MPALTTTLTSVLKALLNEGITLKEFRRIAAAIEKRGLTSNTLLLFSSDNGGPLAQGATNGKLRAAKGTLYEGGVRACAFAHWPGRPDAAGARRPRACPAAARPPAGWR